MIDLFKSQTSTQTHKYTNIQTNIKPAIPEDNATLRILTVNSKDEKPCVVLCKRVMPGRS